MTAVTVMPAASMPHSSQLLEHDLWIAVVGRALLDLAARGENPRCTEQIRQQAYAWIFDPTHDEDFCLACQFAGLDPSWVRGLARTAPERFAAMIAKENDDDTH